MLRKILRKFGINSSTKKTTKYEWEAIKTGFLSGLTLYLPDEWGLEIVQGQHEKEFLEVIKRFAPGGGVFYDVGAHYGWFTAAWLHLGGEYVEAFEPLDENQTVLRKMLTFNGMEDKVRIHDTALGNHTGDDWLALYPEDSSRTFVPQQGEIYALSAGLEKRQISIWTLTDLAEKAELRTPRLIKVDVEGLEGDVIEGALSFLEQINPMVMVEVHSTLNGLRVADQLGRLGYEMKILGMKGKRSSLPLVLWTHPKDR
ncbi:MAG: FkbM family methyltransferase [Anaerolineales bacterium]|nr:FkbM family methyltransferase [Anaerolineales bacterium]